jgi:hypothetical protein
MVDRFIDYPESANNLASLFKNPDLKDLETKAFEILKTMSPKEIAIYMADNPRCEKGLELANKYLRRCDDLFLEKFYRYIEEPLLLELSDEAEEGLY